MMPPEASSRARPAVAGDGARGARPVGMLSSRIASALGRPAPRRAASACPPPPRPAEPGWRRRDRAATAAAMPPATATWLSLIRIASCRPVRWLAPPPQATARLSSRAQPGRRLAGVEDGDPGARARRRRSGGSRWRCRESRCSRLRASPLAGQQRPAGAVDPGDVARHVVHRRRPRRPASPCVASRVERRTTASAASRPQTTPGTRAATPPVTRTVGGHDGVRGEVARCRRPRRGARIDQTGRVQRWASAREWVELRDPGRRGSRGARGAPRVSSRRSAERRDHAGHERRVRWPAGRPATRSARRARRRRAPGRRRATSVAQLGQRRPGQRALGRRRVDRLALGVQRRGRPRGARTRSTPAASSRPAGWRRAHRSRRHSPQA